MKRNGTKTPAKRGRVAYLLVTAVLGAVGVWVAHTMGLAPAGAMALGVGAAWLIQAVAFWTLVGALATGRRVIPIWVGGMLARAGGIAVLWVAAQAGQLSSRDLLFSYVFAILAFLLVEAAWLAIGGTGGVGDTA